MFRTKRTEGMLQRDEEVRKEEHVCKERMGVGGQTGEERNIQKVQYKRQTDSAETHDAALTVLLVRIRYVVISYMSQ